MKKASKLKKLSNTSGVIDSKANIDLIEQEAQAEGLAFFMADCDKARSCSAVLRALVRAVDYPVFFGNDVDELLNCLNETLLEQKKGMVLWLRNFHSADPALAETAADIEKILQDNVEFANDNGRLFFYAVEHVGKHAPPEPGLAPAPYGESFSADQKSAKVPEDDDDDE